MAVKTEKVATASDEKKPDEIRQGSPLSVTKDTGGPVDTGDTRSGGAGADDADSDNATVQSGADAGRKPVVFLGPHHRYSRGDTACFDAAHAKELVERHIAVWPGDARKALAPRKGEHDFDTDIG